MFTVFRILFNIACVSIVIGAIFQASSLVQQQAQTAPQMAAPVQTQNPVRTPAPRTAHTDTTRRSGPETPSETPPDQPIAKERTLPLTPIEPTSGLPSDNAMTIQQCRHDGDKIQCWGYVSISTDIPTQECFHWSDATDDLGNQFRQWSSPSFAGSGQINTMIPNTKYRFELIVGDPHPAVQTMSFIIYFASNCNRLGMRARESQVIFTNVPVQK